MRAKIFSHLIGLLLLCNPKNTMAEPLIGNNIKRARDLEFPSVVCIVVAFSESENNELDFEDDIVCTGTLISLNHVVTAAHCVQYTYMHRIQVIYGSVDVRLGQRENLLWWITHSQWAIRQLRRTRYKENDISMMKLLKPAMSTHAAELSVAPRISLFGMNVVLIGWGKISTEQVPMVARKANITIISDEECIENYRRMMNQDVIFSIAEFCTKSNPYKLLHHGDSGGPVLHGNTILGVSLGTFPNLRFHPEQSNMHASVYFYRVFINEMMES